MQRLKLNTTRSFKLNLKPKTGATRMSQKDYLKSPPKSSVAAAALLTLSATFWNYSGISARALRGSGREGEVLAMRIRDLC